MLSITNFLVLCGPRVISVQNHSKIIFHIINQHEFPPTPFGVLMGQFECFATYKVPNQHIITYYLTQSYHFPLILANIVVDINNPVFRYSFLVLIKTDMQAFCKTDKIYLLAVQHYLKYRLPSAFF